MNTNKITCDNISQLILSSKIIIKTENDQLLFSKLLPENIYDLNDVEINKLYVKLMDMLERVKSSECDQLSMSDKVVIIADLVKEKMCAKYPAECTKLEYTLETCKNKLVKDYGLSNNSCDINYIQSLLENQVKFTIKRIDECK